MSQRRRKTRSMADNSNFLNVGNGTPCKWSSCRRGADPPMNESGRTGGSSSFDRSPRNVSAGNGLFIMANFFNSAFGILSMSILHTRLYGLSAEMMLAMPCSRFPTVTKLMTIGNTGQTSSIFVTASAKRNLVTTALLCLIMPYYALLCLIMPYYALLCLISSIKHNKA